MAELCVYGFIRKHCVTQDLPQELMNLCFLMYFMALDEWDPKIVENGVIIHKEERVALTADSEQGLPGWIAVFGTIIVGRGYVETWKLKRYRLKQKHRHIIIGIISNDKKEDCGVFFATESTGYGMHLDGKLISGSSELYDIDYCDKNDADDITIAMTLDMTGDEYGTLSYSFDGMDAGIAFRRIDLNTKFCLAVSIGESNDGYQIIE